MAKVGRGNFVLKIGSQWRGKAHTWSMVWAHDGTPFTATADMDALCLQVWGIMQPFIAGYAGNPVGSNYGFLHSYAYYNGTAAGALREVTYNDPASGTNPAPIGTGTAYSTGFDPTGALETCTILEAPAGFSDTNKPVFLRKYVRGLFTTGRGQSWGFTSAATTGLAPLTNGGLHNGVKIVSPKGRETTGQFVALVQPGNHQVPRGRKKKVVVP